MIVLCQLLVTERIAVLQYGIPPTLVQAQVVQPNEPHAIIGPAPTTWDVMRRQRSRIQREKLFI
jgi:hypothetical protein